MKRHTVACLTVALAALTLPAVADAGSRFADLRVVTGGGKTLAEFRQYADDVRFRASRRADCFGAGNPSSGRRHRLTDPNPLGVLVEASRHARSLRPLLITDAFVDDGFGFGVCSIGGFETVGFSYWYLAVNHTGASTGPDLIPMRSGDQQLWYLTKGSEPGFPNELVLRAPARVAPGVPFNVKVTRFAGDGSREPAAGVQVTGAPAPTGPDGRTTVVVGPGRRALRATGNADDILSNRVRVCASETASECPAAHGRRIFGSAGPDRIRATRGPDRINCRAGRDTVVVRRGAARGDRIAASCERVIRR